MGKQKSIKIVIRLIIVHKLYCENYFKQWRMNLTTVTISGYFLLLIIGSASSSGFYVYGYPLGDFEKRGFHPGYARQSFESGKRGEELDSIDDSQDSNDDVNEEVVEEKKGSRGHPRYLNDWKFSA